MSMVSIVIPTYQEAENVVPLVEELLDVVQDRVEVFVVDDASPDGTAERARTRFAGDDRVRVIRRRTDRGLARAIRCGLDAARGDRLVVMDADFNHEPRTVPVLLERLGDVDLVLGSRFARGGGMEERLRQAGSAVFSLAAGALLGMRATDNLSGFFAARTEFVRGLPLDSSFRGYGDYYFRLLFYAVRAGARLEEIPIYYRRRRAGKSKTRWLPTLARYGFEVARLALGRAGALMPHASRARE